MSKKRGPDDLLISPVSEQLSAKKMDTKLSPNKDEVVRDPLASDLEVRDPVVSDLERDAVFAKVRETAPNWFVEAFSYIMKELSAIKSEAKSVERLEIETKQTISNLEQKVQTLQTKNIEQDATIDRLSSEVTSLETYMRRDNLLIDGLAESPNEDIKLKVINFFKDSLRVRRSNDIVISRVHRIGTLPPPRSYGVRRPRTVIVRFQYYPDREEIWRASWKLRDNIHYVREDFPDSVRENRRVLLPCFKAARKDMTVKQCYLKADSLIIDGKKYTVKNIDSLPQRLRWTKKGERYIPQCDSTFFFGSGSFLSNHHPSPFQEDDTNYLCVEQYYLQKKSLFFNDETTASAIMRSTQPGRMKALSHQIKGLDDQKWKKMAKATMTHACFLKFNQNDDLKTKLLQSQGMLVEANEKDKFFSCGLSLADPNILDSSRWIGTNELGSILTDLRNSLRE